jgi:hypothetical protein
MELPRYQTHALPQLASVSPQMAGASAIALSQAMASGLDVVAQVTSKIVSAEAESRTDADLAGYQMQSREFVADPRWRQPTINGRPTEEVMAEEWGKLTKSINAGKAPVRDRAAANRYDRGRLEIIGDTNLEVAALSRRLTVDRGKVLADSAADRQAQSGDWSAVHEVYGRALESGLLSTTEYQDRIGKSAALVVKALAQREPLKILEALHAEPGSSGIGAIEALTGEQRERLRGVVEGLVEDEQSQSILAVFRHDAREGARVLAGLESSELDPALLDGIRRKVQSGVSLLREERVAANVDQLVAVERGISSGADLERTAGSLESLYRDGVLSPTQYASQLDRAYATAQRVSVESAGAREITAAIRDGLPLDPGNAKHRAFLDTAFRDDVGTARPGSERWQATALAYASRVRLLPPVVGSWLRSAARSPDVNVAQVAASFYGSLEQTSPEAAGGVDPDARAFLGSFSGMLAAGAIPGRAFETARANVYEARRDVLDQRKDQYRSEVKGNAAALDNYIDRDFDTLFSAQPGASVALGADFERQTAQYYSKTGDVALARDLAWKDLKRVYGPSKINGDAMVMPFPPERFGVSPGEVHAELAQALGAERAAGVLVVPDGLTLRLVNDALTGKPVMPSYRLVTPDGDLLTDSQGVPLRYTLPGGDVLTERVQAASRKAEAEAAANVERVRRRRDLLERARTNPQGLPEPPRPAPIEREQAPKRRPVAAEPKF